jgi:hypothetical protein
MTRFSLILFLSLAAAPAGVSFYHLQTPHQEIMRRVTLVR